MFTPFAWGTLGWNLLVVLWGAYVRASGSGAGCGNRWPLCNGQVAPSFPRLATAIEFAHRASSGVALIAVAGLVFWSYRQFPRGDRVRRAAVWSLVFLLLEALLGAGLVLFNYVDKNASAGRAAYLSLHLVNTELLLGALALTAWLSRPSRQSAANQGIGPARLVKATLPVTILVSITGVIAALGDTLFPASSLSEGLHQDASSAASLLLRLRVFHPLVAVAGAFFIVYAATSVVRGASRIATRISVFVLLTAVVQLFAGTMNIALLTPVWMQIVHLLIADVLWILLVLLTAEVRRPVAVPAA